MSKIININGQRFVLPEGMTMKDVQSLAGFLITLVPVDYSYLIDSGKSLHYSTNRSASVNLESLELVTQEQAEAQAKASREAYDAKKAAEKTAS